MLQATGFYSKLTGTDILLSVLPIVEADTYYNLIHINRRKTDNEQKRFS